uniref:Uncharacterized protein n=1 Tax=Rhizophora mucronata TaxID=61149 RepID=A0A2P2QFX9_RHIMU
MEFLCNPIKGVRVCKPLRANDLIISGKEIKWD